LNVPAIKDDNSLLKDFGFTMKARPGSKYRLAYRKDTGLTLVFEDERKTSQTVSGVGLNAFLFTVCDLIIGDVNTQLRDIEIWQSSSFSALSRKITYNPFYKVAAMMPPTWAPRLPASLGLILMDQKLSLASMSYMLRMTSVPRDLKAKYDTVTHDTDGATIHGIGCDAKGDPTYSIVTANGTYERIRVRCDGTIRSGFDGSSYQKLVPLTFSSDTCSWE